MKIGGKGLSVIGTVINIHLGMCKGRVESCTLHIKRTGFPAAV